jgi:hypothetical protein
MATLRHVRTFALSLPEVTEQDHHGFPSFRVSDRIFATVPDALHLHIMLDESEVHMAVVSAPEAFEELWWGKRLAGVRVTFAAAAPRILTELLTEAWRRRAPRRLLARPTKKNAPTRNVGH